MKLINSGKKFSVNSGSASSLSQVFSIWSKDNKHIKKNNIKEFWALKDISFNVNKGESLGIIGSNGSGKSTLLKLLTGIMKPTKGSLKN